jgi:hydrogenase maturation protease
LTAPLLVLGWGNPSRGDDALGPLFVEQLRAAAGDAAVEWLTDYQLQVEHALDLVGRERVLFVDASLSCEPPFEVSPQKAARDASFTSHALSPAALMQAFRDIHGEEPPPCTLLAIRGEHFELGAPLGGTARQHLQLALHWGRGWLATQRTPSTRPGARDPV